MRRAIGNTSGSKLIIRWARTKCNAWHINSIRICVRRTCSCSYTYSIDHIVHFWCFTSTNTLPNSRSWNRSKGHWICRAGGNTWHCIIISIIWWWTRGAAASGCWIGIKSNNTVSLTRIICCVFLQTLTTIYFTFMSKRIAIFWSVTHIDTTIKSWLCESTNALSNTWSCLIVSYSSRRAIEGSYASPCYWIHKIIVRTKVYTKFPIYIGTIGARRSTCSTVRISICISWAAWSDNASVIISC